MHFKIILALGSFNYTSSLHKADNNRFFKNKIRKNFAPDSNETDFWKQKKK